MDILRFITAGSVDDGKSTLTGRLLYDTKSIKQDIMASITDSNQVMNLAHITDGLRAERNQGITIDIAYKYYTTKRRKYIIADAPGHVEYTRNLVTGASDADLMIILIDAQNGITEQTRRHSLVASFLKMPNLVVVINKMDIKGYDEHLFSKIKKEYLLIAEQIGLQPEFIPISALNGDNVSFASEKMKWYMGKTLEQYLESCMPAKLNNEVLRLSIQCTINGQENAGKILTGTLKTGDKVAIHPQQTTAIISKILNGYDEIQEAQAGDNICLYFSDNRKLQRGDLIFHKEKAPKQATKFEANICWLDSVSPLQIGKEYYLRIYAFETTCHIIEIVYKTDIATFEQIDDDEPLKANQFAKVRIVTNDPVAYDSFAVLPDTGRGIIIDIITNYTSGAFTID